MSAPRNIDDIDFGAIEALVAGHAREFLVDAVETLGNLGILVSETHAGKVDAGYTLQTIRREVHTLKGLGGIRFSLYHRYSTPPRELSGRSGNTEYTATRRYSQIPRQVAGNRR